MIEENTMLKHAIADTPHDEDDPSFVYHELVNGRLVPVEMGGLVELALFELGGQIVDAIEQPAQSALLGLN
jgi:hypothetical protein